MSDERYSFKITAEGSESYFWTVRRLFEPDVPLVPWNKQDPAIVAWGGTFDLARAINACKLEAANDLLEIMKLRGNSTIELIWSPTP